MSPQFDPYLIWLAIRDPERPPNYYRLLGLELFEPDPEVIRHAVERQSHYVRRFLAGEHSQHARRLLEELTAAGKCLLEPKLRATYDAHLRRRIAQRPAAQPTPATEAPGAVPPAPQEAPGKTASVFDRLAGWWQAAFGGASARPGGAGTAEQARVGPNAVWRWVVACLLVLVVLLTGLILVVARRAGRTEMAGSEVAHGPQVAGPTSSAGDFSQPAELPQMPPEAEPSTPTPGDAQQSPMPESPGASAVPTGPLQPSSGPGVSAPALEPGVPGEEPAVAQPLPQTAPAAPSTEQAGQPAAQEAEPSWPSTGSTVAPAEGVAAPGQQPSTAEQPTATTPAAEPQSAATGPASEPATEPPTEPARLPVPEKPSADAALADLRAKMQPQLQAAVDPAQKTALAQNLLGQAGAPGQDPTTGFVMLREAARLALEAGAGKVLHQAIVQLGQSYEVDVRAEMAAAFLSAVEAPYPPIVKADLAMQALWEAEDAADNEQFDAAEQLARAASSLALKAKDSTMAKQAGDFLAQLPEWKRHYELSVKAAEILAQSPDLPQANLALGKYLCFFRRSPHWEEGLPYLAKGDDPALKALAEAELQLAAAAQATPSDWVALADRWYEAGRSADAAERAAMVARAAWWYRKALPVVSGFTKLRVENRLTEIGATKL